MSLDPEMIRILPLEFLVFWATLLTVFGAEIRRISGQFLDKKLAGNWSGNCPEKCSFFLDSFYASKPLIFWANFAQFWTNKNVFLDRKEGLELVSFLLYPENYNFWTKELEMDRFWGWKCTRFLAEEWSDFSLNSPKACSEFL